jgi:integrase
VTVLRQYSDMHSNLSTPGPWVALLDDYVAWQQASHRPATTTRLRRFQLRRFARVTGLAPEQVTLEDIVVYMGNPNWGASYCRSIRTTLRSFYGWAYDNGRVPSNPSTRAPQVTVPIGKSRPAEDEALALGESATDERVRLMVRLGNECGMRCNEIAQISTHDVQGRRNGFRLLVHGKGSKERFVPISNALAEHLRGKPAGFIFPGRIDGHLSGGYVSKLLSAALGEMTTGHQLRHRAGTRWMRTSGGNLRIAQELLGHASLVTTQIYTYVDDDQLRSAALAS